MDTVRYLARQPILDQHGRVRAYELLFRESGTRSTFTGDGEQASRTMLDNTLLFGLEQLTDGLPAFINCTAETLTSSFVSVLPTDKVVLEILEDVEPTQELIAACQELKAAGFRFALDDFLWRPELEPLIELAEIIKFDFLLTNADERRMILAQLGDSHHTLLAEKIESQEEFEQACSEGFTLFQGYYFCRPTLLKNRKIPANHLTLIEILQELNRESFDLHRLAQLVKRDAAITYRLLRLVNSPVCGLRQEVSSIEMAIMVIGEESFRRLATLAISSEMNAGQAPEVLRLAFERGRFCEQLAPLVRLDPAEQYLLGLLSLLPAMLRLPMESLLPSLPLSDELRDALLGRPTPARILLDWIESHEQANWANCDRILTQAKIKVADLVKAYTEALEWSDTALRTIL